MDPDDHELYSMSEVNLLWFLKVFVFSFLPDEHEVFSQLGSPDVRFCFYYTVVPVQSHKRDFKERKVFRFRRTVPSSRLQL